MTLVLVALLGTGLAGCTSDRADKPNPPISVFLEADVTEQQRQAVEARLRAVPDAAEVVFESGEEAYARFKEVFKDDPELVENVRPDSLPASFILTMRDGDAFARAISGPLLDELRAMSGVGDVVYSKGSPPPSPPQRECLMKNPELDGPVQTDWQEISVFLTDEVTDAEKQAIEARLRAAVPGAPDIRLETREEAAERFREIFKDRPELVGSGRPEMLPESYRVRMTDPAVVAAVADSDLGSELCRMPGVDQVAIPPKFR